MPMNGTQIGCDNARATAPPGNGAYGPVNA
jgi:hypothetical protein